MSSIFFLVCLVLTAATIYIVQTKLTNLVNEAENHQKYMVRLLDKELSAFYSQLTSVTNLIAANIINPHNADSICGYQSKNSQ